MNAQSELRTESEATYSRDLKQAKARFKESFDRVAYDREVADAQEAHRARLIKA